MSPEIAARNEIHHTQRSIGKITLVVPVRDEVTSLGALVASIRAQARRPDEVIFVDGGSADGTAVLARELAGGETGWQVIEVGDATPGRGRNIGIAEAGNDWIALTDAGIVLDPGWLDALEIAALDHPEACVVWGAFEPRIASRLDECAAIAYVAPRTSRGPSVASCLVHRTASERAGGFPDLRATEDLIFIERLRESGVAEAWAPTATVTWSLPPTVAAVFRRFRTYSEVNVRAGRQDRWHYGVARMWGAGAAIAVGALVVDDRLWGVLGAGVAARAAKAVLAHRDGRSLAWACNPLRVAGVAGLLAVLDIATFAGWIDALRRTASYGGSSPPGSGTRSPSGPSRAHSAGT